MLSQIWGTPMLDKLRNAKLTAALAMKLRSIWHGTKVITPKMVVDSIKAVYVFLTGKVVLACLVILFLVPQITDAVPYNLGMCRYLAGTVVRRSKIRLVVVSATWCSPCKHLYPTIKKLYKEGYNAKVVYDYDGPEEISAYPTLLFYNGNKLIHKHVGVVPESYILERLKK